MNRIERYLGGVVVSHTLLVWFVLLVIFGFTEFMNQLGRLGGEYTLSIALIYSLLKLPVYGYEVFPIALLIGTLMGLGGLANHSELTILRVTGWSIGRIFIGVMKVALVFWFVVAAIGEWVAPEAESYATKLRAEALQRNISIGDGAGFWMREPERLIHVQRVVSTNELHGITIYPMQQRQLSGVTQAQNAIYEQGAWRLNEVEEQVFEFRPKSSEVFGQTQQLHWSNQVLPYQLHQFPIDPELLSRLQIDTRYMRIDELYRYIDFLENNGLDARPYELEFWRKVASTLVVLGMIALVFPLIFGSQRQVSMGQRIFIGILIGMGFHLLNQILGNLSVVYQWSPMIGAFLPSLLLLAAAYWLFKRLR